MASLSDITVAISTNISNFQKGLDRAQRRLQKAGKSFKEAGTTMSQSLTLPLAAAGAAAVKVASDFEDAMVEIEKVTSKATAEELRNSIKAMAAEIPLAQSELAGLAADAARFGVSGPKAIEKFTRTAAKMATATQLATQEAGESLAKLAEITNTPISKMENLGSAINSLSNTAATSSQEIVDNMLRASKGLSALGVNQKEMAGLAATLNEVSPNAKNAGTQLNRLSSQLLDPRIVKELSKILGMTASEFNNLRKNSPVKLMQKLASSFNKGGQQARKLRAALSEQSVKAVSGLAQNLKGLTRNLNTSSTAFRQNTSLSNEAQKAYAKFSSKLQVALNRLRNVGITIGNILMPLVLKAIGVIESLLQKFASLSTEGKKTAIIIAGIAAAIGPLLFVLGKIAPVAFIAFGAIGNAALLASRKIRLAMASTGIGLLVAALGTAAAAIIANWNKIVSYFKNNSLGNIIGDMVGAVKKAAEFIVGAIKVIWKNIKPIFNNIKKGTEKIGGQIFSIMKKIATGIWEAFKTAFSAISDIFFTLTDVINQSFGFIINIFQGDIRGALKNLQNIFQSIFFGIIKIVEKVILAVLDIIKGFVSTFSKNWANALDSAKKGVKGFSDKVKKELNLKDEQQRVNNLKNSLVAFRKEAMKAGEGSLDFGNLFSGFGGGGGSPKKGDSSLSKVTRDGGFSSVALRAKAVPDKAKTIPDGALQNVKGYAKLQDKAAQSAAKLNKQMARQAQRQRRNAAINQKAGQIIGRTMKRTTKQLTKTFSAALVGTKSLAKGMAAFGDFMQKMFQRLIQKVIQLITKLLVVKAIQATLGVATGGLGSGIIGGLTQGVGGFVGNLLGGGGGSGGLPSGGRTINLQQRGDTMRSTLDFNKKKKNRAGVN